jgi:hypothetical protein
MRKKNCGDEAAAALVLGTLFWRRGNGQTIIYSTDDREEKKKT